MGKASELDDFLDRQQLTPEEMERRKMRLRPDVLEAALPPERPIQEALNRLGEGVRAVALYDPSSGATAITVPLDKYFELVTAYLRYQGSGLKDEDARSHFEIMALSNEASTELGVEQGDPQTQEARLRLGDQR